MVNGVLLNQPNKFPYVIESISRRKPRLDGELFDIVVVNSKFGDHVGHIDFIDGEELI